MSLDMSEVNSYLLSRHEPKVIGDQLEVKVFKGSFQRKNRQLSATLRFPIKAAQKALESEELLDLVLAEESKQQVNLDGWS